MLQSSDGNAAPRSGPHRPEIPRGHSLPCAYGSLSAQFSTDEKVAQNSRGLSCHRWLQPYVKPCPGYGLLGQLTDIADGAAKLVGG
jgi:hypothetical protein